MFTISLFNKSIVNSFDELNWACPSNKGKKRVNMALNY